MTGTLALSLRSIGAKVSFEIAALHAAIVSSSGSLSAGVTSFGGAPKPKREDLSESVNHVLPGLGTVGALADRSLDLRDPGNDPPVTITGVLIEDRQLQRFAHRPLNGSSPAVH